MQEIEASREARRVGKMDTLQARMANLSRQIDDLRQTTASLETDFATSTEVRWWGKGVRERERGGGGAPRRLAKGTWLSLTSCKRCSLGFPCIISARCLATDVRTFPSKVYLGVNPRPQ